ncbi:MAG: helicase-related protein, partial [Burkholderiales bacterium]
MITEGILARLLQQEPALSAYAIVLFDEFHERRLQADTGLALCLESQRLFRPDLRLLVMSATLDCGPVSDLLGQAPVIACEGRLFPVETRYLDQPLSGRLDVAVVQSIRRSLAQDQGSLLVFLPGMAEIRLVERKLLELNLGSNILISPLHGELPQEAQDRAIAPAQLGTRKIVLATSIAETSLTIDGVRVVIDAGLLRVPRFNPRSGLTRLETIRVTQDSAEQRRGRAGRLEPGVCVRLWTAAEHRSLAPHRPPELLDADLAPLLLELALWGTANPVELSWLTPPPPGAVAQARELLTGLNALNLEGQITTHGKQMADLPLHPRLAHMLLKAVPLHLGNLACELAALLSERDILRGPSGWRNADLRLRLDVLHGAHDHAAGATVDRAACQRVRR